MEYKKMCAICGREFVTDRNVKNICSFECRMEHNRQHSRHYSRMKRSSRKCEPCIVCGFSETTDRHREGDKTYILCPNHHALITRGKKTLQEVLLLVNNL